MYEEANLTCCLCLVLLLLVSLFNWGVGRKKQHYLHRFPTPVRQDISIFYDLHTRELDFEKLYLYRKKTPTK